MDSALVIYYKPTFDSLYNALLTLDTNDHILNKPRRRVTLHEEIEKLLYEDWPNLMEKVDSTLNSLPVSVKERDAAALKYNTQLARFMVYGDEDRDDVILWAEMDAKAILRQVARDPGSVKIEKVICDGKVKNGWKCRVQYRAKNGFGGYEREVMTVIMKYDVHEKRYKLIDASY